MGDLFIRRDYIFIISHIRSYSSLIAHILGSHPEISGYAEMHQSYKGWLDFLKLQYHVYMKSGRQLKGRYVLDKILHDTNSVSRDILMQENVKVIFMLRDPEDTIRSIINMGNKLVEVEWYRSHEKVLNYYRNRLEKIADYALTVCENGLFMESERSISDTDVVLEGLSSWLGLKVKLSSNYSIFQNTGVAGYGDPSSNIKAGKVIKKKSNYSDIHVPSDMLSSARDSYEKCRAILLKTCSSL